MTTGRIASAHCGQVPDVAFPPASGSWVRSVHLGRPAARQELAKALRAFDRLYRFAVVIDSSRRPSRLTPHDLMEIPVGLQAYPKLRGHLEQPREPPRRIRRNPALAQHNLVQPNDVQHPILSALSGSRATNGDDVAIHVPVFRFATFRVARGGAHARR